MVNESHKIKKRVNNERAAASEIKLFICFFCGDQFTSSAEYQRHLLVPHQAFALCYQLYNSQLRSKRKLKVNEVRRSLEKLPEKLAEKRTAHPEKSKQSKEHSHLGSPDDEAKEPKQRRLDSSATNVDTRKSTESTDVVDRGPVSTKSSASGCKLCGLCFMHFHELIRHMVSSHNVVIDKVVMHLYKGEEKTLRKTSPAGNNCPPCNLLFSTNTQYYEHLLAVHISDVFFTLIEKYPGPDNVETEVTMNSPNGREVVAIYRLHLNEMS